MIQTLEQYLDEASRHYYNGNPIISDEVFDQLAQSIENVKSLATIWNEYFTALVYLDLQQSGYRTVEHIKNMIKVNAEYADHMLVEYKERHGR